MIQKKIIKILQLIVGVAKYCRVSMRCPKFRFPIRVIVIVFDQLELISLVSQGLTLSTGSQVFINERVDKCMKHNIIVQAVVKSECKISK